MSTLSSMEGRGSPYLIGCRANRADNADIATGDALQWDRAGTEGLDVKQPVTTGLRRDFAGIAVADIEDGEQRNAALAFLGPVRCKFLNNAAAAKYTYATPVTGQDYLTYSATPTNIILLTDQTTGTAVHGPSEGDDAPVVLLLPNVANAVIKAVTVEIEAVETAASDWVVIPEAAIILGAYAVTEAAITGASANITFEIGGTPITSMAIECTVAGAAAGKVYTAAAPTGANVVTAGQAIEVVGDGGSDTGGKTMVTIFYIPN
jgi:hypothetical protein